MHPEIPDMWFEFSEPFEGRVLRLYADVIGLVSTGVGNLLDAVGKDGKPLPIDQAWRLVKAKVLEIPWELPGGGLASAREVEEAWRAVRSDPRSAALGHKFSNSIAANRVRLTEAACDKLVLEKLREHDKILAARFKNWDDLPLEAQLATHSMAWGMGAGFPRKFPKFSAALEAGDFVTCSAQCAMAIPIGADGKPKPGTIVLRNKKNRELFLAAARAPGAPAS